MRSMLDDLPDGRRGFGMARAPGAFSLAVAAVSVAACASAPRRGPVPPPPPASAQPARPEIPRETLTRLSDAVDALAEAPPADEKPVVEALRQLANAIVVIPSASWLTAESVRQSAKRLEASAPGAPSQAQPVKAGLRAALEAVFSRPAPAGHGREYQQTIQTFGRTIEGLSDEVPLRQQHTRVAGAFRAAADAVFLAAGGEAPFGEAETGPPDRERPESFADAVAEARAAVLALARTDWTQVQPASARALAALARVLAAVDQRQALGQTTSDIKSLAERVRYADALSYGRASWIRTGLASSLDGLEKLRLLDQQRSSVWAGAARRAVASIDERRSLALQRAAIQDAFRATIDAFVAAEQSVPARR